jgi:citrate lyase beta subunit
MRVRALARRFCGKVCIHPQQVPIVNRAFGRSEREVAWARAWVDAFRRHSEGVLMVNAR